MANPTMEPFAAIRKQLEEAEPDQTARQRSDLVVGVSSFLETDVPVDSPVHSGDWASSPGSYTDSRPYSRRDHTHSFADG